MKFKGKLTVTGLLFSLAGASMAAQASPAATANRCWGEVASGLAQYESPNVTEGMSGGPMGMHSRSAEASAKNGGFATNPVVPVTQPRSGAGNVSGGAPHLTAPGDGGNGQHAVNNGEVFSTILDPVTGTPMPGTGEPIECSLDVEPNIGS